MEYQEWKEQDLSSLEVTYQWADGIYVKAGLEKNKAALLVIIGALTNGKKVFWRVRAATGKAKNPGATCCGTLQSRAEAWETDHCRRTPWDMVCAGRDPPGGKGAAVLEP